MRLIKEKQDLCYLSWSVSRKSFGIAGSFLKSYSELGEKKIYYKLSNFDKTYGVIGHECVNELIVDRLLTLLDIPHLSYQLIHADVKIDNKVHEVYLCASEDFKDEWESKVAFDTYKELEAMPEETALDFALRMGWGNYLYQMFIVDYLILNRDRHGTNIEILRNSKMKTICLAPLFDHGLSLLCSCTNDEDIDKFDVMADKPCNNYFGSRSVWNNLHLFPKNELPQIKSLKENDKQMLLKGLNDVISLKHQNKIWEMIWKRWNTYEDFRNSR